MDHALAGYARTGIAGSTTVEGACRLYSKRPGQNWGDVNPAQVAETQDYIEYMWLWESERDKNVGMDWKATYWRLQFFPPPPQQVLLETGVATWTPDNTVVHGSDKVLKWDPEVPANCDTDAATTPTGM